MRYANIKYFDVSNGTGIRTSLYVSGCEHHCKGCFNAVTWDFNYGEPFTQEIARKLLDSLSDPNINGLSILGGEPLHPNNVIQVGYLVHIVKKRFGEDKTIWVWSGYTLDELASRDDVVTNLLLSQIDVLVDGKFEEDKKDLTLKFRGSSNQRVINMVETIKLNRIVLKE